VATKYQRAGGLQATQHFEGFHNFLFIVNEIWWMQILEDFAKIAGVGGEDDVDGSELDLKRMMARRFAFTNTSSNP